MTTYRYPIDGDDLAAHVEEGGEVDMLDCALGWLPCGDLHPDNLRGFKVSGSYMPNYRLVFGRPEETP